MACCLVPQVVRTKEGSLVGRKAVVAREKREARASDRSPTASVDERLDHRYPLRRHGGTGTTRMPIMTDNRAWRDARSTDHSVKVFAVSRGPRQGTDRCEEGPPRSRNYSPIRSTLEDLLGWWQNRLWIA